MTQKGNYYVEKKHRLDRLLAGNKNGTLSITFENVSKNHVNYRLKMSAVGYNNNIFGALIL